MINSIGKLLNNKFILFYKKCMSTVTCFPKTDVDFSYTGEELELRDAVRKISTNLILPHVKSMENLKKLDPKIIKMLFNNGLMGIEIPERYGGSGMSLTASLLAIEELAKVDPSVSLLVDIQNTLSNRLIEKHGSTQQKEKYLSELASSKIMCFCLSEESSGSDAFALKTRAIEKNDEFIINGSKMWISNSKEGHYFLVMANAIPEKGYRGISCFVIDSTTQGVTVSASEQKMGLLASSTCVVTFDNVKIPKECLIGKLGEGYKYAISELEVGRIGIGAQMIGAADGCLSSTLSYLKERKQFNSKIWDFQAVRHQVAQMYSELQASRVLVYTAARAVENGHCVTSLSSIAKLISSQTTNKITSQCIDLMGGVGFTRDYPIEKFYRDCKVGTIYEGTNNILLNTIAKYL